MPSPYKSWLRSGEFYLVVAIATFLRLYRFNTTQFDYDQAVVFQMAYDAAHHGYLVATSNMASIHIYNPPAIIYFLMLPAAFTDNPLWGAIAIAMLMIISVVLTYLFVRRYYGRIAAAIAALTYATALRAIIYSRFIWNQNLLPLFVILLVMFLFQGVVARKPGWVAPALLLLGLLVQLHGTGIFMAIPLGLSLLLAPETVRKRDVAVGAGLLLILYAPYLLWEFSTQLIDVRTLLQDPPQRMVIDGAALHYYSFLLDPYSLLSSQNPFHWHVIPFIGEQSFLGRLSPYLGWISQGTLYLLVICTALVGILAVHSKERIFSVAGGHGVWQAIRRYWQELRSSPFRCGLIILLGWQFIPLVILVFDTSGLHLHYFIFFLPGPFILLGIGMSRIVEWLRARNARKLTMSLLSYGVYLLAAMIIVTQCIGSIAGILDLDSGHYDDGHAVGNLYNDLRSLENALTEAEHVAQEHHLSHIYISTDWPTQSTLRFLSLQMPTPATLFTDQGCVVLPGANQGPAVMLVGPYSDFTDALVRRFTSATLVDRPPRAGGAPFRLYIVKTPPLAPAAHAVLGDDLQLLSSPAQPFTFHKKTWLVSQWELLRSVQPGYRRVYGYNMTQTYNNSIQPEATEQCAFTAMRTGDRVLVPLEQNNASVQPGGVTSSITVEASAYETYPYYLKYGPLTFETYEDITTPSVPLKTASGDYQLVIAVPGSA